MGFVNDRHDPARLIAAHQLECAEEDLAALAGLRGGRLRLISFQSGGATLAPRAVASFHERHPSVELSMIEAEPEEAGVRLRTGDADLALVYDHASLTDLVLADLELVHLLDDRYEAILPAGHRFARRRRLSLGDLAEEPWIASTGACGCRQITESVSRVRTLVDSVTRSPGDPFRERSLRIT